MEDPASRDLAADDAARDWVSDSVSRSGRSEGTSVDALAADNRASSGTQDAAILPLSSWTAKALRMEAAAVRRPAQSIRDADPDDSRLATLCEWRSDLESELTFRTAFDNAEVATVNTNAGQINHVLLKPDTTPMETWSVRMLNREAANVGRKIRKFRAAGSTMAASA